MAGDCFESGAQVVLDYLHAAMKDVAEDPNLGHYRRDLTDRPVKFNRKNKKQRYFLVFDPDTRPIRILRVANIRRDSLALLGESSWNLSYPREIMAPSPNDPLIRHVLVNFHISLA